MATAAGVSHRSVQRIWAAHGLKPHRVKTFRRSNDPKFAAKVKDVVGFYVDPPEHALVPSVDEKSQIQALDRTQPGLPMKKGRCGTMTHKRHGTTTLFAALDGLDGRVIGQCMARHRHQEFLRFLNKTNREIPAGRELHLIVDNSATHKHPKVRPGWNDIPGSIFTSPRPRPPGSTPSLINVGEFFMNISELLACLNGNFGVSFFAFVRNVPADLCTARESSVVRIVFVTASRFALR